MNYNFEDFIVVYPKQDDPNIQRKIGTKKEFLEDAAVAYEAPPSKGGLYKHQRAFLRYMRQMDRMLNIQSVGTGKTCALVALSEYYKKNPGQIRHVYILEKGSTTVQEFKNQIAYNCTTGDYLTSKVTNPNLDERVRKNALTREIHKWYSIMSYGAFIKQIRQNGFSEEMIEENYSGCIFFVDEAHNLNEDRSIRENFRDNKEPADVEDESKITKKDYEVLWDFFHKVKRSKIILATATPMLNDVSELAKLMNLILPSEIQMPLKWDYDRVTLSQMEPFFRGRISYVRALETGAIVRPQGDFMNAEYKLTFADDDQKVPFVSATEENDKPEQPNVDTVTITFESQDKIYSLPMSKFQSKSYIKTLSDDKEAFDTQKRQASCLVFPDGTVGGDFKEKKSDNKFIEKTGRNSYSLTKEFTKHLRKDVLEDLATFSCKYYFIIKNELEAAGRRARGEIVGNAFSHSDIVTGGGAIALGLLLEYYGFEKYNRSGSVFTFNKDNKKVMMENFNKKLRYGILSSDMSDAERTSLLEMFNSDDNFNGEYCQIIISSPASRDGINVANVLRGYLNMAGWHNSGTLQALARFVRATSHATILSKMNTNKVDVKVYKLASIPNQSDIEAVDIKLYKLSEKKDIKIRRMMRFMKQCAFDCTLHHNRNIRSTDIDGSAECDYGNCAYTCYPSEMNAFMDEEETDFSTYDILYADSIIEECKNDIVSMFNERNIINIKALYSDPLMSLYKPKFINRAINLIIKERITIKNRFGFTVFINTDGNNIFTQMELPTYNNINDSSLANLTMYKDIMFGTQKNTLDRLILELSDNDEKIIKELATLDNPNDNDYETFSTLYDKLSFEFRMASLEESLLNTEPNKLITAIHKKFANYFFVKKEPYTDIQKIKNYLETSTERRGRTRKENQCPKVNIEMQGQNEDGELVIIHDYQANKTDTTAFSVNSNFLNSGDEIRIFKFSEGEWRDVYPYECQAYKNLINKERQQIIRDFKEKYEHIGTLLSDKKFRIINTKDLNLDSTDKRIGTKGLVCNSYEDKIDVIEILLKSNYMPEEVEETHIPKELSFSRQSLENYLIYTEQAVKDIRKLDKFNVEELKFIVKYFLSKKSKQNICKYVQDLFEREKRIITL